MNNAFEIDVFLDRIEKPIVIRPIGIIRAASIINNILIINISVIISSFKVSKLVN